jgi:hypothetical protein
MAQQRLNRHRIRSAHSVCSPLNRPRTVPGGAASHAGAGRACVPEPEPPALPEARGARRRRLRAGRLHQPEGRPRAGRGTPPVRTGRGLRRTADAQGSTRKLWTSEPLPSRRPRAQARPCRPRNPRPCHGRPGAEGAHRSLPVRAIEADQRGAPIRVSIFDDRLEVENPGLLTFGARSRRHPGSRRGEGERGGRKPCWRLGSKLFRWCVLNLNQVAVVWGAVSDQRVRVPPR